MRRNVAKMPNVFVLDQYNGSPLTVVTTASRENWKLNPLDFRPYSVATTFPFGWTVVGAGILCQAILMGAIGHAEERRQAAMLQCAFQVAPTVTAVTEGLSPYARRALLHKYSFTWQPDADYDEKRALQMPMMVARGLRDTLRGGCLRHSHGSSGLTPASGTS